MALHPVLEEKLNAALACAAIESLPNSKYRDSLLQLADFAINRKH